MKAYTDIDAARAAAESLRSRGHAVAINVRNGYYVLDVQPPIRVNIWRKPINDNASEAPA